MALREDALSSPILHNLFRDARRVENRLLVYRGHGWNVQHAVARGAKLASGRGGNLWYTSDEMVTLEYLETFRGDPRVTHLS